MHSAGLASRIWPGVMIWTSVRRRDGCLEIRCHPRLFKQFCRRPRADGRQPHHSHSLHRRPVLNPNHVVRAPGFEPGTIGLKVRPDLRMTPPQGSCRIRFSASRLLAAPAIAPAWLYKLAIHPKALSDRLAPANANGEAPSPPRSVGRMPYAELGGSSPPQSTAPPRCGWSQTVS
jgi:hypothetical protein